MKTVALAATGTALVAALVPRAERAPMAPSRADKSPEPAADGGETLRGLTGQELGPYRVESVGAMERGGIPVHLAHGALSFRVDVLRADPSESRPGIGFVSAVSVYLRNGGNGRTPTDETMGLGAMALAEELARREREGWKPPAGLMTMGERASLDALRVG